MTGRLVSADVGCCILLTDCLPCSEPALGLFSLEWVSSSSSTTALCLANLMNWRVLLPSLELCDVAAGLGGMQGTEPSALLLSRAGGAGQLQRESPRVPPALLSCCHERHFGQETAGNGELLG